jgi:hypothetical protein
VDEHSTSVPLCLVVLTTATAGFIPRAGRAGSGEAIGRVMVFWWTSGTLVVSACSVCVLAKVDEIVEEDCGECEAQARIRTSESWAIGEMMCLIGYCVERVPGFI